MYSKEQMARGGIHPGEGLRDLEGEAKGLLHGAEAGREKECTGETEPGSRKIWAAKNCGLNVKR